MKGLDEIISERFLRRISECFELYKEIEVEERESETRIPLTSTIVLFTNSPQYA